MATQLTRQGRAPPIGERKFLGHLDLAIYLRVIVPYAGLKIYTRKALAITRYQKATPDPQRSTTLGFTFQVNCFPKHPVMPSSFLKTTMSLETNYEYISIYTI